jgi:hypothetical protein
MASTTPKHPSDAIMHTQLLDGRSSNVVAADAPTTADPLAVSVAVRRARLALLTVVMVAVAVAVTIGFSRGVVLKTFERSSVSIADQEKLLERYNSYSGTVTAAIERPLDMGLGLIVQVVTLRLLTGDVLQADQRWQIGVAVSALSAGTTYLFANGLSAVNVQARELPVRLAITAEDLRAQMPNLTATTTFAQSFAEDQPENPTTNTILRNLVMPQTSVTRRACRGPDTMDAPDTVDFRLPQYSWMKDLLPTAAKTKSMTIVVSASNARENAALTPEQFPMNASVAADLLVYSLNDPVNGSGWGANREFVDAGLFTQMARKTAGSSLTLAPTARVARLLPPSLTTTERQDREWFLQNSGPTMFNVSDPAYKNASSLRNWTMTLSRVDIAPGSVWVDAVTIEREVASPRLETSRSKDGQMRYQLQPSLLFGTLQDTLRYMPLPKASGASDDRIDIFSACVNSDGEDVLTTQGAAAGTSFDCFTLSNNSLLVVSRGKRLVADSVVRSAGNATLDRDIAVAVNVREIFSVTVARISWVLQDLSAVYNARCDVGGGCMGLDVALPGSGQRLVVSKSALPAAGALPLIRLGTYRTNPIPIVSVRRPQFLNLISDTSSNVFIGDILLPHNVRNVSAVVPNVPESCDTLIKLRMAAYVNNHAYIERTLQPAYMTAAFFLFQNGVPRAILNQTWTTTPMLAFSGNTQDVDVYVYVPTLSVLLTLAGCVLLVALTAAVVLWPCIGLRGQPDPLVHITAPNAIANIVLNEKDFPSALLSRSVTSLEVTNGANDVGGFAIRSLSLQRKGETDIKQ